MLPSNLPVTWGLTGVHSGYLRHNSSAACMRHRRATPGRMDSQRGLYRDVVSCSGFTPYVGMYVCMYVCVYVCMCMYVCVCIYIHIYTHIYAACSDAGSCAQTSWLNLVTKLALPSHVFSGSHLGICQAWQHIVPCECHSDFHS